MKMLINVSFLFLIIFCFLIGCQNNQSSDTKSTSGTIELEKARTIIESLDKQFSKDFYNGDSVA